MVLSEESVVTIPDAWIEPPDPTVTELGQEDSTASTPSLVPEPTLMASDALFAMDSTVAGQVLLVLNRVTAAYGEPPWRTSFAGIQARGAAVNVKLYFESGSLTTSVTAATLPATSPVEGVHVTLTLHVTVGALWLALMSPVSVEVEIGVDELASAHWLRTSE